MKSTLLLLLALLPVFGFGQSASKSISVNNAKIAYRFVENPNRKPNEPVIVFESGLGMGGGNFETVFPYLPKNAAYFVYDRNGLGESETDKSLKSDADVVMRLHDILQKLQIKPPYLLVGHSLGGPFIRLFDAKFPTEVSGMVFIDPTDFMLTENENALARNASKSKIGYRELWPKMLSDMASDKNAPEGLRDEMTRESNSNVPFFKEYQNLPPLADKPVAVLIAYNRHIEKFEQEMNAKLGINGREWFDAFDKLRIAHYSKMIGSNENSFLMLLPQYSHGIHNQDPALVGEAIGRVLGSLR